LTVSSWALPPVRFATLPSTAPSIAGPPHAITIVVVPRAGPFRFRFHETPHSPLGLHPEQTYHFPAAVGSHLGGRSLEQLSDTIVFPLWATLMPTAILPVPQLMHRTIGCRPTLRACAVFPAYTGFAAV